jgi:long-subunit fatty acid transport protein
VQKALVQPEETKQKVETSPELELIKGKLQMEVVETYVSSSSNQIFIEGFGILPILIVGNVEVQKIRRDSFISTLTTRYKISPNLQLAVNVPYMYMLVRTTTAAGIAGNTAASPNKETLTRNYGLGDVNGSLNYQMVNEGLVRPSISASLGFKGRTGQDIFQSNNPTGSGFNSISASLNFSKFADPAGIFGYLSYAYAMARNNVVFHPPNNQPAVLIDFMPGDNIGLGFGIAYALNYKVSLSMQYQQSVNLSSRINGKKLPDSEINAISLRFGVIWRVNANLSVDLSVSPGLTLDAPDSVVALRLPWRF